LAKLKKSGRRNGEGGESRKEETTGEESAVEVAWEGGSRSRLVPENAPPLKRDWTRG